MVVRSAFYSVLKILVVVVMAVAAPQHLAAGEPSGTWPKAWLSKGLADHPLVGKIYAPRNRAFVEPKAYLQSLAWPRFVLLGEIHDNPDHHLLQALAIRHISGGDKLSVVFEHFRSDQQTVLSAFQAGDQWMKSAGGDDQLERLFTVTLWDKSGWPDKKIFKPLFKSVLERNALILAGNPPRSRLMNVARKGADVLSSDAQSQLLLDRTLGQSDTGTTNLDDELLNELEASHCGLMPKSAFGNMAVAQRFRDGFMARTMVDATIKRGPVALIAGNGHVRLDRGVPWYIRRMIPKANERPLISVGHVEVVAGQNSPTDYAEALKSFSLIVFTPRVLRPDPCEKMRKRFGKHKRK